MIENLKIYDFVVQNVFYDAETSQKIKDELIGSISTTRGMIQAGERIISRGEVIHNENFRVLESLRKEYKNLLGSNFIFHLFKFDVTMYSGYTSLIARINGFSEDEYCSMRGTCNLILDNFKFQKMNISRLNLLKLY